MSLLNQAPVELDSDSEPSSPPPELQRSTRKLGQSKGFKQLERRAARTPSPTPSDDSYASEQPSSSPRSPSPPPEPEPAKAARPSLPYFLSRFRGSTWFEHHYPRATPKTFDFLRPAPSVDGVELQIPFSSVVQCLYGQGDDGSDARQGLLFLSDSVERTASLLAAACLLLDAYEAQSTDIATMVAAANSILQTEVLGLWDWSTASVTVPAA